MTLKGRSIVRQLFLGEFAFRAILGAIWLAFFFHLLGHVDQTNGTLVDIARHAGQISSDSVASVIADNEHTRQKLREETIAGLAILLAVSVVGFYILVRPLAKSLRRLGQGANEIVNGNFNVRIDVTGKDELAQIAGDFNAMAETLQGIAGSVQRSGVQISTSAMEIAATARQQQATANEIAQTTSRVSATAHDISSRSQELATTMREVATGAERTATLAGSGQDGIIRMETTMRQISAASDSISARLGALSEKAGNINTVVTTIAKVADQTNMLSLNAAIEAEKAGEYGRGFAVVATEIRRLADQTATATGDIEQIVKEMQSAVTAGVMGMDKFADEVRRGVEASRQVSQQLTEIIAQVQTFTPNFEVVNDGMQTQAEGAQQISQSLSQLGAAVQQTAESLVQSNQAIEQLNEASHQLQTSAARFAIDAA